MKTHTRTNVRAAHTALRALLVTLALALPLVACGSNPPSPSLTVRESALPPSSGTPAPVSTTPGASPGDASSAPSPSSGGSPSLRPAPSAAPVALEACALLDGDELSKILGVEGVQPRPMPSVGWVAGQCAWNGPSSGFFVSVGTAASIAAFGDLAAPNAEAKFAQFKDQSGGTSNVKDVPGLGDGAALAVTGLAVYKGGTYLQFTNLGLTEDQLIEIAKLALSRV